MGRSVPTYRNVLDEIAMDWSKFRRALREEDRIAFDRIVNLARLHASASAYQAAVDPLDAFVLSVLLEHQKLLDRLRRAERERLGP